MTKLGPAAIRAYLARDWGAARAGKRADWSERVARGGLPEALAASDQLRMWSAQLAPSGLDDQAREADLETHQRVAQALLRTSARAPRKGARRVRRARQA